MGKFKLIKIVDFVKLFTLAAIQPIQGIFVSI
jgi:hypothetical protein